MTTHDDSERSFTVKDPASDELPKIDFSTFVLSLATSALYQMGLVEDPPDGPAPETNLPLARQTVDTLEMLQAKTQSNLDEEETKLLESVLYEVRMAYVRASQDD